MSDGADKQQVVLGGTPEDVVRITEVLRAEVIRYGPLAMHSEKYEGLYTIEFSKVANRPKIECGLSQLESLLVRWLGDDGRRVARTVYNFGKVYLNKKTGAVYIPAGAEQQGSIKDKKWMLL